MWWWWRMREGRSVGRKAAADDGSRASTLDVASRDVCTSPSTVRMPSAIQPCSSEVEGRGQSGRVYGANTGAAATAAMEPEEGSR